MRVNHTDSLTRLLSGLTQRVTTLENSRRSQVAVVTTDPPYPVDGDIWVRSSDGALRLRVGGVTRTVTLT